MAALVALWAVIYLSGLSHPALLDDVDTVHAEAAREMVLRHDWVTLYANGVRYLEKAPMMYWSVATSYTLFGMSEWSTRFPLMLFMLATILSTYGLGCWAFGAEGGFNSAVVLATALGPFLFTRFLIPDVAVGLWLTLTFWLFLQSLQQEKPTRWICWGLAAVCALNVLTKGLIGLVFPVGAIGLYLLLTGNLRHLLKLRLISSTLVFFAIAAPWHILAALRNPPQGNVRGFLWFYFVNEHFLRFLNKRVPRDYDTVPLLLFWALLVLWLLPWTVFIPQSLREIPRRWRELRAKMTRRQQAYLLFFLWNLVIVGFFSLSTRQEYYTIPAIPGLALLVGGWLQRERESPPESRERRSGRISSAVLLVVGVIIAVTGFALLIFSKAPAPGVDLSDLLKKNPQDYALSFGHFLDLTPQAMGAFRLPLFGFSLAISAGFVRELDVQAAQANRRRELIAGRDGRDFACLRAHRVWHFLSDHFFEGLGDGDSRAIQAGRSRRTHRPLRKCVYAEFLYWNPSAQFACARRKHVVWGAVSRRTSSVGERRVVCAEVEWPRREYFLWTDQENPQALQGLSSFVIAQRGGKTIFSNQPTPATR